MKIAKAVRIVGDATKTIEKLTGRLARIREIIESVDNRCLHADGPVTPTLQEMEQKELSAIYALACGKPESWRPK